MYVSSCRRQPFPLRMQRLRVVKAKQVCSFPLAVIRSIFLNSEMRLRKTNPKKISTLEFLRMTRRDWGKRNCFELWALSFELWRNLDSQPKWYWLYKCFGIKTKSRVGNAHEEIWLANWTFLILPAACQNLRGSESSVRSWIYLAIFPNAGGSLEGG